MQITKSKQAGITILEIQMYGVLFAIFIVILSQFFASSIELQVRNTSTAAVDQEAKFVIQRLQFDGLRASEVTSPADLGQTAQNITYTIGGLANTYQLQNGVLQLNNNEGTVSVTSPLVTVSNLQVKRSGNPGGKHLLQISFDVDSSNDIAADSGKYSRSFSTVIGLR